MPSISVTPNHAKNAPSPYRLAVSTRPTRGCLASLFVLCILSSSAWGAASVHLTLVTDGQALVTAQHEWARNLARAGVTDVRIRAARVGDRLQVEDRGTPSAPIYAVTGQITSSNEVRLPGAKFRSGDAAGVARWLDDLARHGPVEKRPKKTAFGLDAQQFEQAHVDLSQPVGFPTLGIKRADVIRKMAGRLAFPLKIDRRQLEVMGDDKVAEELSGLSSGTALACVVRPAGLCLIPQPSTGGAIEYAVVAEKEGVKSWPVGWESKKSKKETLPKMLEFIPASMEDVPLPEVLEILAKRLGAPILLDHHAMARHGIDPAKTIINLPQSRTTYGLLLRRVLLKARLKSELRVDEAGTPLFWVTTVKRG